MTKTPSFLMLKLMSGKSVGDMHFFMGFLPINCSLFCHIIHSFQVLQDDFYMAVDLTALAKNSKKRK